MPARHPTRFHKYSTDIIIRQMQRVSNLSVSCTHCYPIRPKSVYERMVFLLLPKTDELAEAIFHL